MEKLLKKIEFWALGISIIALFFAFRANVISKEANEISKSSISPYFKIEYFTVKGCEVFNKIWELEDFSELEQYQLHERFGVDETIWKIETASVFCFRDKLLLAKVLEDAGLSGDLLNDSLLAEINFEILHIKNVVGVPATNVKFITTERMDGEVVNEYKMDVALNTESIFLLRRFFTVDGNDTINIGAIADLEKVEYDGFDGRMERMSRERFKRNHIIKSVYGNGLIAQCPFVYSFKNEKWLLEDAIIKGFDSKEKKQTSVTKLDYFNGRIKILEVEDETSFIDNLYINAYTANNDTITFLPLDNRITSVDDRYLVLQKSESVTVDFYKFDSSKEFVGIELFANGYYESVGTDMAAAK